MNSQQRMHGGLWNTTKPAISKETQELLKVMMNESKLTNFQKRTIKNRIENGQSLPKSVGPTFTRVEKRKEEPKKNSNVVDPRTYKNGLRNLEEIVKSGAYDPSYYRPPLRKPIGEKEKDRLTRILVYGKDDIWSMDNNDPSDEPYNQDIDEQEPEKDRFDELLSEIKERVDFLEAMTRLGRRKEYEAIILAEISQKRREMEQIDEERTKELKRLTNEKK